ncbi:MAG: cytochrome [Gammaproteobacteria bacterium]|nr:MAG: cytochrome [Gammaproteobacteria bacterium]
MIFDFNPYDRKLHDNPYPVYSRLRNEEPVYYNEDRDFWVVSRYQDVKTVIQNPEIYSSSKGIAIELDSNGRAIKDHDYILKPLIMMDPPQHTGLRRLVQRAFTNRRIAQLEDVIRKLAVELIEPFKNKGQCELVSEFAGSFPVSVISDMLGCDPGHRVMFKEVAGQLVEKMGTDIAGSERLIMGLCGVLNQVVEDRKENPLDDIISVLVNSEVEGEAITDQDLYAFVFLLLVAGSETTTNLLTNAFLIMDKQPEIREALIEDPSKIPQAVEEFVRFDSPAQGLARSTTKEAVLGGVTIPAGEQLLILFGSANRDGEQFEDPDKFILGRKDNNHIAFGFGVHFCMGANLARLEAKVALEELLRVMPDFKINHEDSRRLHAGAIRGMASLPLSFSVRH